MNERHMFRVWSEQHGMYWNPDDIVLTPCGQPLYRYHTVIDPKEHTIEQCTGLLDCNKNFIYEGDILSRPDSGRRFFVKRARETPMFIFRPESDDESIIPSSRLSHLYKIIGNIHEVK